MTNDQIIFIPYFGRSGFSTTGCSGMSSNLQYLNDVTNNRIPSIQADNSPMHTLYPPPNGKKQIWAN